MTNEPDDITVCIKYKGIEKAFSGTREQVWLSINTFFSEFLPTFQISQKLALNIDLQKLAQNCEEIIALGDEGPYILVPRNKLTDIETLELLLLGAYLSQSLTKAETASLSKAELQAKLGKTSKIASTRLGELVKSEIVARTQDEHYRITSFGIFQMQKEGLPKIKSKLGA